MSKICSKCNVNKDLQEFYVSIDKRISSCKVGEIKHRASCKSCDIKRRTVWKAKNYERELTKGRARKQDPAKAKIARDKLKEKNPDYHAKAARKYYLKNKEAILKKNRKKDKERRANDPIYKVRRATSNLISSTIRKGGFRKTSKSAEILGCDWLTFRKYLEDQFAEGMTWGNYGFYGWHIDHKIPAASAATIEELEKLNHYTNFQPLWAKDNLRKSSKHEGTHHRRSTS